MADGLTDAAVAYGDDRPTFPAASPSRRLDAIFVDSRLTVTAYGVIATESAVAASDHLPVAGRGPAGGLRFSVPPNAFDLARF